jgi:hypothetical protein
MLNFHNVPESGFTAGLLLYLTEFFISIFTKTANMKSYDKIVFVSPPVYRRV